MKQKLYEVYEQRKPIPTGVSFKVKDMQGRERADEWHRANLCLVGKAATFADAKLLTLHPIMESVSIHEEQQ